MTRQQHAQDRNHWDVHLATSFVDNDGDLIDPFDATDRFNTRFVVRRFDTGTELAYEHTVADIGIDGLSIRNAIALGFSTAEYHAAMRYRILEREIISSEEQLAEVMESEPTFESGFVPQFRR